MRAVFYTLAGAAAGVLIGFALPHIPVPGMSSMAEMQPQANMAEMHDHPMREVTSNLPAPAVSHLVFPDAMDGYNVQILPRNFEFTPAAINRAVQDNQGHAHLYINGVKIQRVYSNWFHLPSSLLQPGVNLVSITLNANDHSEWAQGGTAISSTVRVVRPE